MNTLKTLCGISRKLALAAVFLAGATSVWANLPGGGTGMGPNVTIVNNGNGTVTLANGIISLVITTNNSYIAQIYYTYNNSGTIITNEVYNPNGYYFYGGFPLGNGQYTYSVATDPANNGGDMADIRLISDSPTNGVQENHWSMRRGSPGFYVTATWTHRAQDGYNSPGVWGSVMPTPGNFNWLSADFARNYLNLNSSGGVASYNNPHESGLSTSGAAAGLYGDKFITGLDHCDLKAWGFSSVGPGGWNVGIWDTTTLEFSDGGPYKRDVSAYGQDVNNSILTGEIGMGGGGGLVPGEIWTKTMGPWFIYFNNVTNTLTDMNAAAQALFTDATAQADAEAGAWPYSWFTNNLTYGTYAQASGRGTVTGHLAINDSGNPNATSSGMWIGLLQQQAGSGYDFQKWQKAYQFFVHADTNGNFTVPNVIAGTNYTLWAFGAGAEGTFMSQNQTGGNPPLLFNLPATPFSVTVTGGATNNLGTVTWTPTRVGATVFELGYSDRVARDFRHGEDYWSCEIPINRGYPTPFWGMPMEFPSDFPNGMNYTVGQSRWTTDWNYDMPSLPDLGGNYQNCVGTLTFNLATAPTNGATGSIYFDCASDNYAAIIVSVNGNNLASASGVTATPTALVTTGFSPPYQDDSDYHMSDHSSVCDERITFPASLLHSGQNTITITMNGVGGSKFLMLDYLRLELTGYVPPAPAGVAAYAGNNCNLISWPVTPGATSYNVLRSTTSGSGYASITNGVVGPICGSGTNNAVYVDTTAANNTTYYYVVQSVNPTGTSANSAQSAGAMPLTSLSSSAPAAPTGMTVTGSGHHSVALSWNASAGASFYSVYRTTLYTNFYNGIYPLRTIILNNTNTGTTYTDTTPTDAKIYSYYVTATSAGGTSGSSTASAAVIPLPVPPASAPGLAQGHFVNGTNASLSWAPVAGAVGYDIYRSTQQGVFSYPGSLVRAIVETNYTDSGLATNQDYFYQIVAVNEGGPSPVANVMVLLSPVALGLAAFPGDGQVTLNWSSQVGATNYLLEVSTTNGGPYTVLLNTTNTSYVNTGLTNGTTYYYIVYSQGPNGQSPVSAQASATPSTATPTGVFWTNTITASAQSWNVNTNWNNAPVYPNSTQAVAVVNSAIGANQPIDLNQASILQTINLNQAITVGGLFIGSGGGAFTLAANGGTLTFNNLPGAAWLTESPASSGDTIATPITVNGSLQITNLSVNPLTLAGNLSSSGGLTINDTIGGGVILSGTNSYTGGTVINAGNIKFTTGSAMPSSGVVTLNNTASVISAGTVPNLVVNGNNSLTVGNLNTVTFNNGTLNLLYNGEVTCGGTISGTGRLVLAGSGTTARFTGSLGAANVIFDLGTGTGSYYERNNQSAVALGGLAGGPNTSLSGDANSGVHNMIYTIGGANVDTEFDGRITDGSTGNTGITKTGTGKLVLTGATNNYTGPTTINNGSLVGVVGGNCSNSAVTVAATGGKLATLGVAIADNTQQWTWASLTVNNGGTSSILDFNFGTVTPSLSVAPLNVLGAATFTTTPVVTVDLSGSPVTVGAQYPLMTWGSVSGTAPTNATMKARGVSGHLLVAGNTLYLTVDSVVSEEPLRWAASPAGVWDTTSVNWVDNQDDPTVYYATGDQVVFDDTYVTNDVTVTVNSVVTPVKVAAANSAYDYTITGTGSISGSGGLAKSGTGTLTLGLANTFTGDVSANGGTLTLDFSDPNAPAANLIPAGDGLTLGGGNLNINGDGSGTSAQAFSGTTLTPGAGAVTVTANGTATLGAVGGGNNPPTGTSMVFNGPATIGSNNAAVAATGVITTTTAGKTGSALGSLGNVAGSGGSGNAWATVGLYDWASTFTTNGVQSSSPYTIIGGSQVPGFYTAMTPASSGSGYNNDMSGQEIPGTTQNSSINNCYSVRFNSPNSPYSSETGDQTGGYLITPNMGLVNAAISSWRPLNDLQIVQNNTSAVFILGGILNSSGNAIIKSGAGTWFFDPVATNNLPMNYVDASTNYQNNSSHHYSYALNNASGNYVSELFLNGGVTVIATNGSVGLGTQGTTPGSTGTINLNGGTLLSDLYNMNLINPSSSSAPRNVYLGGNGGGLAADAGHTMTVPGVIVDYTTGVPGTLTIGLGTAPFSGSGVSAAALVPGTGNGATNSAINPAIYATGTVDLSGGTNTYSGGTILLSGTAKINGINNLGGTNYGGLTFNGGTLQYAPSATGYGSLDLSSDNSSIILSGGGGILDVNGNNITYANAIGNYGGGALKVMSSATNGSLTLSGANTYTGGTTVSNVTLTVNNETGSATGLGDVQVQTNATLGGSGSIAGNVTVNRGGQTLPGSGGATITIGGNLTYNPGASNNFYLDVSANGAGNNQIILSGTGSVLTFNGTSTNVGINCGSSLDQSNDYVLFNLTGGGSIAGTLNPTPVWLGTPPTNAAVYAVLVNNNNGQVVLHNTTLPDPPVITVANASPNPVLDYQTLTFSATVTPGFGAIDPAGGVTVNLGSLGGPTNQVLVSDGVGDYTNSVVVGGNVFPGGYSLVVTVLDNLGLTAQASLSVIVGNTAVWDGADAVNSSNWSDGSNWVDLVPPGAGVDVYFAGGDGLMPVMDSSYPNLASVTFSNNAGSFILTNSGGSVLTLTTGLTNNSANVQTVNLPVALGGMVTASAASNSLALNGVVSGGGALTVAGPNPMTLTALNTYTGGTTINPGGVLVIGGAGELGGGNYAGSLTNNGAFIYNSSAIQTVAGVVSGGGLLQQLGSGELILVGQNTCTGATIVSNGTLMVSGSGTLNNGGVAGNLTNNGAFIYNSSAAQTLANIANAGILTFNSSATQTVAGVISGGGLLRQTGSGALILTAVNTYTGATAISNGILMVSGTGSLNSGSYAGNITNNGTFIDQSSVGQTLSGIISGTGSNVWNSTAGLTLNNNANTYSGGTFINKGSLTLGNLTCYGTGPVVLGSNGYSGTVSLVNGLSGTFTNALIVNPGGTREYYTAGSPSGTWSGLITLVGGATFEFGPNGNSNQRISGGTAGNGTLDICYPQSGRTAVVYVSGGAVNHVGTLENTLSGAGSLAQIDAVVGPNVTQVLQNGTATMKLTATNTYAGPTTISQGTLYLTGSASISNSTMISVASNATFDVSGLTGGFSITAGQTLNGSGSVNGAVTVAGTLAPTNAAGGISTLIFSNNLTLAGTALFALNKTNPLQTNSEAVLTGAATVAYGGALVLTNLGPALQNGDAFTLFHAAGYSGNFTSVITQPPLASGLVWNTNSLNSAGQISVVAVSPKIGSAVVRGTNLILQGSGGVPAGLYYILGSTNVALPLTNWTRLATNPFDATGNFNCTNPITPNTPQQFYRILLP